MKIEVKFTSEPTDPPEWTGLDGKTLTAECVDRLNINTSTDSIEWAENTVCHREPLTTGEMKVISHGLRAVWSE